MIYNSEGNRMSFTTTWTFNNYDILVAVHWGLYMSILYIETNIMMTSSNGNIFRVAGPLCGDFTGHRLIPLKKASDAELWCFLWSAPEQTLKQTIETPEIWNAIALIMMSL